MMDNLSFDILKDKASDLFKKKEFDNSIDVYTEVIKNHHNLSKETESILYSNIAMCQIKLKRWKDAKHNAELAIERNAQNMKARYRYALACEGLGNLKKAFEEVQNVLSFMPQNKEVIELYNKLQLMTSSQYRNNLSFHELDMDINNFKKISDSLRYVCNPPKYTLDLNETDFDVCYDNLVKWIKDKTKRLYLLEKKVPEMINDILLHISRIIDENLSLSISNSSFSDLTLLTIVIQMKLLSMIHLFLINYIDEEQDINPEETGIFFFDSSDSEKQKIIKVDPIVEKSRNCIQQLFDFNQMKKTMQKYLFTGLKNSFYQSISLDSLKNTVYDYSMLKTSCCLLILKCVECLGSFYNESCVSMVKMSISTNEAIPILKQAFKMINTMSLCFISPKLKSDGLEISKNLFELVKVLITLFDPDNIENTILIQAESAFVALFQLNTKLNHDFEISWSHEIISRELLVPYLCESCDPDHIYIGYSTLRLLFLVDRNAAEYFVVNKSYLEHAIQVVSEVKFKPSKNQLKSSEILMLSMESNRLRDLFINCEMHCTLVNSYNLNSRHIYNIKYKLLILLIFTRLTLHNNKIKEFIFEKINFVLELADVSSHLHDSWNHKTNEFNEDQEFYKSLTILQMYLEFCLFLTMHGCFKKRLQDYCTVSLSKVYNNDSRSCNITLIDIFENICTHILKKKDYLAMFHFSNMIGNFLKSNKYKDIIRNTNGDSGQIQLEENQKEELKLLYSKFPELIANRINGEFDRGDEETVFFFNKLIMSSDIPCKLIEMSKVKEVISTNTIASVLENLSILNVDEKNRPKLVALGIVETLLLGINTLHKNDRIKYTKDIDMARRAIAHSCISTNPVVFSYTTSHNAIPQLIYLLSRNYELYTYEATLALTNLASFSDQNRNCIFLHKGIQEIINVATSENSLCRAAGIECLCNMALCSHFTEKVAKGCNSIELQLLLAFLHESSNIRAQIAAAGALALLTTDAHIVFRLLTTSNHSNIISVTNDNNFESNNDFKIRIFTVYSNILKISVCFKNVEALKSFIDSENEATYDTALTSLHILKASISTYINSIEIQEISDNSIRETIKELKKHF